MNKCCECKRTVNTHPDEGDCEWITINGKDAVMCYECHSKMEDKYIESLIDEWVDEEYEKSGELNKKPVTGEDVPF